MSDRVDKKYLDKFVEALNEELDSEEWDDTHIWGEFKVQDRGYLWCDHIMPTGRPEMMLTITSHAKDRAVVHAAGYPTRKTKEGVEIRGSVPDLRCTFSMKRSVKSCARDVVKKILNMWPDVWATELQRLENDARSQDACNEATAEIAAVMGIKVPVHGNKYVLLNYPSTNTVGRVAARMFERTNPNDPVRVDLEIGGLSLEDAKTLLQKLNSIIAGED